MGAFTPCFPLSIKILFLAEAMLLMMWYCFRPCILEQKTYVRATGMKITLILYSKLKTVNSLFMCKHECFNGTEDDYLKGSRDSEIH